MAIGSVNMPGKSGTRMIAAVIPKGRMRGDVDGDGKITKADARKIQNHLVGNEILTGIDLWCCDVNGDGDIDLSIASALLYYIDDQKSLDLIDYYGNWTQVNVSGQPEYWTTDIAVPGLTAGMSAVITVSGEWDSGMFSGAEVVDGAIRISSARPPIRDVPCHIIYGRGDGSATICARTCSARVPRIVEEVLCEENWNTVRKGYVLSLDGISVIESEQLIQVFPNTRSADEYNQCGVFYAGQDENRLHFAAKTIPTKDLTVRIVITDLN